MSLPSRNKSGIQEKRGKSRILKITFTGLEVEMNVQWSGRQVWSVFVRFNLESSQTPWFQDCVPFMWAQRSFFLQRNSLLLTLPSIPVSWFRALGTSEVIVMGTPHLTTLLFREVLVKDLFREVLTSPSLPYVFPPCGTISDAQFTKVRCVFKVEMSPRSKKIILS